MSKPTFVVDLDGTLTEDKWPELGLWLPGAVRAMHSLSSWANIVIDSCRVNPYEFGMDGIQLRPASVTQEAIAEVRAMLDAQGLHHIPIHTTPGKPSGDEYIDNKARRYLGRPKSWDILVDQLEGLYRKEA